MIPRPSFEHYLATATGLSKARALELYRAGCPWPLFTTEEVRKAAAVAQANGISFDEALSDVEVLPDPEYDELLLRIADVEQAKGTSALAEKVCALAALPCLQEGLGQIWKVATATHEPAPTIFRLFLAILRYAMTHPDWEPDLEPVSQKPRLVC